MKKIYIIIIAVLLLAPLNSTWSQMVINEIMFNPNGDEPEWIELFNNNDVEFADSLRIQDPVREYTFYVNHLLPKTYCVLVKDTALIKSYRTIPESTLLIETKLPGLNNDKDTLYLKDNNNSILDNFIYKGSWSIKGYSLERSSPLQKADNNIVLKQSKAADSATCGRLNSILPSDTTALPSEDKVELNPNPFAPNSYDKKVCNIKLSFSKDYISLKISCYDLNGVLIRTLADEQDKLVKGNYNYTWDGLNEQGYPVQPGIYPLIITYKNEESEELITQTILSVVGN